MEGEPTFGPVRSGVPAAGEPIGAVGSIALAPDGSLVFSVELHEAVAANPYLEFYARAEDSGILEFAWSEDGGAVYSLQRRLTVT